MWFVEIRQTGNRHWPCPVHVQTVWVMCQTRCAKPLQLLSSNTKNTNCGYDLIDFICETESWIKCCFLCFSICLKLQQASLSVKYVSKFLIAEWSPAIKTLINCCPCWSLTCKESRSIFGSSDALHCKFSSHPSADKTSRCSAEWVQLNILAGATCSKFFPRWAVLDRETGARCAVHSGSLLHLRDDLESKM